MLKFINYPSPNYWNISDLPESGIKAVTMHGTSGTLGSSLAWFQNPKSGVSSNYIVSKAGNIYEVVSPITKRAWANGIVDIYDNTIKWLDDAVKAKQNPNWFTWSIEHEASLEDMQFHRSMPDAQFNASIDLTGYLLKLAKLKATHDTVVAHCQICAKAKPYCPGVIFVPAYVEVLQNRYPELKGG